MGAKDQNTADDSEDTKTQTASDAAPEGETKEQATADNKQETETKVPEKPEETGTKADDASAKNAAVNEPEKKKYTVCGCRISHNGKIYPEGSKILLTADEAAKIKNYVR